MRRGKGPTAYERAFREVFPGPPFRRKMNYETVNEAKERAKLRIAADLEQAHLDYVRFKETAKKLGLL
jgi:hypothetical protein